MWRVFVLLRLFIASWLLLHICHVNGLNATEEDIASVVHFIDSANQTIVRYDREYYAKLLLSKVIQHQLQQNERPPRKRMLCTTYMRWSERERDLLVSNIASSGGVCTDWVFILYDSRDHDRVGDIATELLDLLARKEKEIMAQVELLPNGDQATFIMPGISVIKTPTTKEHSIPYLKARCDEYVSDYMSDIIDTNYTINLNNRDDNDVIYVDIEEEMQSLGSSGKLFSPCQLIVPPKQEQYNQPLISKGIFFLLLLQKLPEYDYVWLLDSDMSFDLLNLHKLNRLHATSFPRDYPSLVTQVLITPDTQGRHFLNRKSWNNFSMSGTSHGGTEYRINTTSLLAIESDFVEIQAPIIHSEYFQWFVLSFLVPFLTTFQVFGTDWGIDYLFCPSARLYEEYLYRYRHHLPVTILPSSPALAPAPGTGTGVPHHSSIQNRLVNGSVVYDRTKSNLRPPNISFACSLLIADLTIHHCDFRTGGVRKETGPIITLNRELIALLLTAYPLKQYHHVRGGDPLAFPENYYFLFSTAEATLIPHEESGVSGVSEDGK